ncbi:MAG: hypothetical protein ABSF54_18590 [Bryobacteraceae bacterium]|jgi:DNA-binding NtrC family response regulator
MEPHAAILLIGPLDSHRGALRDILAASPGDIHEAATYGEAVAILNYRRIAVAICDAEIEGGNWQALWSHVQSQPHPPNLIVSSRLADERLWAEVLNLGGYDVLAQPFDPGEVLRVAQMACLDWRRRCLTRITETRGAFHVNTVAAS